MKQNEAGYATVTAAGILAGLSLLSISFLNLSDTTLKVSNQKSSMLLLDGALEAQLADTVTKLANGIQREEDFPLEGELSVLAIPYQIIVESERGKLPLNQTTRQELLDRAGDLGLSSTLSREIADRFSMARNGNPGRIKLEQIIPEADRPSLLNCLKKSISEFKVPAVFKRADDQYNLDGEILRIKIQSNRSGTPNRGLETFVLFTGDRFEPVWTLDWTRYSVKENQICPGQ